MPRTEFTRTSPISFSPNFTLDSVADSNYRGKCDISGFLIFEWTLDKMDERDMKEEGKELKRLFLESFGIVILGLFMGICLYCNKEFEGP
jgi:hypothetical protein